jgi:hypothetical protein
MSVQEERLRLLMSVFLAVGMENGNLESSAIMEI